MTTNTNRTWPPDAPSTPEQLAAFILQWADRIFIRAQVNGTWGAYALTELSVHDALQHALRYLLEGRVPSVLAPDDGPADVPEV